eukprot:TRINITY_DN283_c0_g1_i1.p1 TRINITY_DN283_c0_g1~~TRINITY_DN283_c0_g1_i1.p1  ORF type:complete len:144 (+),score=21.08 TRINITY_DN283_c0_g1_i1:36-467(+)
MGRQKAVLSRAQIEEQFHLPIKDAAQLLGISVTTLKQRCREYGIKVWPFKRKYYKKEETSTPIGIDYDMKTPEIQHSQQKIMNSNALMYSFPYNVPIQAYMINPYTTYQVNMNTMNPMVNNLMPSFFQFSQPKNDCRPYFLSF